MTAIPLLRLWQQGTITCLITPATQPAPYRVVIRDGNEPIHQRAFDTHNDAINFALDELRRAEPPDR
jgi:hypothetical protein